MANGDEGGIAFNTEELKLKREELVLKKRELDLKEQETESLQKIEKWKTWGNVGSVFIAALALAIPVWIAAINIRAERVLSEDQAKLTFQMKVADLAFADVTKAEQAKERAQALAKLFSPSQLLPDEFAQNFNPEDFKLDQGGSVKRRERIVNLIAQYPDQRRQILSDWYVFFHWDQWWVEPLLKLSRDEKNFLDDLSNKLRDNQKKLPK